MSTGMILGILVAVTLVSSKIHGSLPSAEHEFPLMYYTKLISEEHFTAGRPLVITLPLAEESTNNEEVGYLIQGLHTSGRWPILVYNINHKINGNTYTEIQQHGSYIIQISGPCKEWEELISRYLQLLYDLFVGKNAWHSWNPGAKFVVSVMTF